MKNARIMNEYEKDVYLLTREEKSDGDVKHKVVERRLRVRPEMVVIDGNIYYDYTEIMHYAFETGQQMYVRKEKTNDHNRNQRAHM